MSNINDLYIIKRILRYLCQPCNQLSQGRHVRLAVLSFFWGGYWFAQGQAVGFCYHAESNINPYSSSQTHFNYSYFTKIRQLTFHQNDSEEQPKQHYFGLELEYLYSATVNIGWFAGVGLTSSSLNHLPDDVPPFAQFSQDVSTGFYLKFLFPSGLHYLMYFISPRIGLAGTLSLPLGGFFGLSEMLKVGLEWYVNHWIGFALGYEVGVSQLFRTASTKYAHLWMPHPFHHGVIVSLKTTFF